nr:insulinase (peptidase family M16) family protein [Tanacetum cinerariifolium]
MTVTGTTFSSDDIVIKSPNDRRLYRYIQLPNGLCALLVHDPDIYADGPPQSTADDDDDDDDEDEDESGDDDDDD